MDEPTINKLVLRLDRLERENRRLKRIGALVVVVISGVFMMGQALPKNRIVEAEKFVLKDTGGKVRAILGAAHPYAKAPSAELITLPATRLEGYGLHLYGADGRYRSGFAEWPGGGGYFTLRDTRTPSSINLNVGSDHAVLELSPTGASYEEAEHKAQRKIEEWAKKWDAAKTAEERYSIWADNPRKINVAVRLRTSSRWSSLKIGTKGNIRAVLGYTKLENTRTGVVEHRPVSSLVLFDKDGKAIWKAP